MIYSKARIKSLLTRTSRRRSLHSELKVLMVNTMASNIAYGFTLEAVCIITHHLPHGSIYYIYSSFISSMCGVLKYCGPVACKLNICVYATLILGADISVDSAPGLQALQCKMYRIRQSLFYLYDASML